MRLIEKREGNKSNTLFGEKYMGKITTKKFSDGIAFYEDGKEFAFYSNITQKVRYNARGYLVGCTEISFEKNLIVINMIKKYIRDAD